MDEAQSGEEPSTGFPPIAAPDARVLILGSLPSRASLAAGHYYAHPRNQFWRIMAQLAGGGENYDARCERLRERGIAVWDVLASSVRPGSLDANIRLDTARVNDFPRFFRDHPGIGRVCFNGRKAEAMFRRFVDAEQLPDDLRYATLPSTSPAHAALGFEQKLDAWRGIIAADRGAGWR